MEEKQTTLINNFGKLEANVGTQLESIDKKTADTQNNLKELQQVIHNTLKEFHQVLFSHPLLQSLPLIFCYPWINTSSAGDLYNGICKNIVAVCCVK